VSRSSSADVPKTRENKQDEGEHKSKINLGDSHAAAADGAAIKDAISPAASAVDADGDHTMGATSSQVSVHNCASVHNCRRLWNCWECGLLIFHLLLFFCVVVLYS